MRNSSVRPETRQDVPATADVRPARAEDIPRIAQFIRDLAAEESFPGAVTANESDLETVLFGADAFARAGRPSRRRSSRLRRLLPHVQHRHG